MAAMEDPFQPFRELMVPLSGVKTTALLQRGDKKIFLIGEYHVNEFCRDKGFIPLCSILEEYLLSRTEDKPVDFMLEFENEDSQQNPLEETKAICSQRVNTPYPSSNVKPALIDLVRDMVAQYIPPVSNPVRSLPPRTAVSLPNARVHWLDPRFSHPTTRGDLLIQNMYPCVSDFTLFNRINRGAAFNRNQLTTLYINRTVINDILGIQPDSPEGEWALRDQRVIEMNRNSPSEIYNRSFAIIPDRALFLKSTDASKLSFVKKVYEMFSQSKFFTKCYSGPRFIKWEILEAVFLETWRKYSSEDENTIDYFYFIVGRFLMDFYTCCRILKEEGRWYKNIVIYAGAAHTDNIEQMLLLLDFQNVPLPPIPYNPLCSATGGKSRKQRKRKTRVKGKPNRFASSG